MIRRTTICALIMFAVCAFFAVDKANAQRVWGSTGFVADPTTKQLFGFHATRIDAVLWDYYEPAVEGFIENQFQQVMDSCSEVDEIGLQADCTTQITFQPGKTYFVISDHYLGMFLAPVEGGGGVAYWNPFGFGFSGPPGFPDIWSFFPGFGQPYYVVQFIYLGSTGWRLDFFGEPHIDVMSPTSSQLDSNIELHFEGTNLGGNPSVNISGSGITKGAIVFSTETRLTINISIAANAPPGDRSVSISTRGYTSNSKTFTVGDRTPHIDSLNPSRGDAGTVVDVTISGTNFGINPAVNVTGGITAQVLAGSTTTQINSRFTIPAGTIAGDKFVTVFSNGINGTGFQSPGGGSSTSNSVPFTVNAAAAPRITDYSPKGAPLGTSIQINVVGENFGSSRTLVIGGSGVTVVSYTAVSDPDHQIVATLEIAENAETGDHSLRVSAGGQLSNSVPFRVGSASVVITSVIPPFGMTGTTQDVTINGRGFGTDPAVGISGTGVNITINQKSDTSIQATFQISTIAEALPRLLTVTSRGINGSGFIQSPGGNQSASTGFDVRKAKVTITAMDARFAPGAERLNITYEILPAGTIAPFARLEIFKNKDKKNPVFVDNDIPKTGIVQYSQGGNLGWDGKDSNGHFIVPDGSPYTVKISIDDNPGFTHNRNNSKQFKIEMFLETAIAQASPVPTPAPTPGKHDKEYNIIKPWKSIATEINTEVSFKILYLSKDGQTKKPAPIPYKVEWSFKDIDDTSDNQLADSTGSKVGDDNATVAEGGKRTGNADMWKAVTNFTATINPGGQTATSDVTTSGPDTGTTKIGFLSSAIGGDNYQIIATIKEDTVVAKKVEFKKWSVRKNLDFSQAFQVDDGTNLRDYVSQSIVEGAFNGEGYTDYHFNTSSIRQVAKPNNSEYLIELLQPKPLTDPTPELPTQAELNDYNNGNATQKQAAKTAITAKAQSWYDRNFSNIQTKLTQFLTSLNASGDAIIGANLYHFKHNGTNEGKTNFYPSDIVIQEKTVGPNNTLIPTGATFDPDELWKPKVDNKPAPVQGFETSLGQTRYAFVFSNVPTPARKVIVGRHEIGHASDHVLFGRTGEPDPTQTDHWTEGLMHRRGLTSEFAPDSIVRLRGRKRLIP